MEKPKEKEVLFTKRGIIRLGKKINFDINKPDALIDYDFYYDVCFQCHDKEIEIK